MPEQITPLSTLYLLLHGAGTAVSAVAHLRRHDALRGDRCAADRHAIRRPHDPEQGLWADPRRGGSPIGRGGLKRRNETLSVCLFKGSVLRRKGRKNLGGEEVTLMTND